MDFVKDVLAQSRVRLIGVCFGHQIVGRAMDVKVDRSNRGWEVSVTPVDLTPKGKQLFGVDQLVRLIISMYQVFERLTRLGQHIHQMHRDIVYVYPDHVEHLGHTARCEVQGMYVKHHLITVQGHPEFTGDVVSELLEARHDSGVFDDTLFKDGMSRVRQNHDGVAVAAAFIRFLLEE